MLTGVLLIFQNEKAFRNFSKPLSIITDEGFLNGSFKKKCDSLNAKAGDLLTIARSIMQSVPSLKEEEDEEDLPSPNKYFKPLEVLLKEDQLNERNMDSFPDGTYFNVGSDLDVVSACYELFFFGMWLWHLILNSC